MLPKHDPRSRHRRHRAGRRGRGSLSAAPRPPRRPPGQSRRATSRSDHAHADRLRPAPRQRLGARTCCAAPSCAQPLLRGARRTSIGWCCSATCSSCATARRARRSPPRGRSSRISARRSPGGELVIVAGNHDHALIEPWLALRARAAGAGRRSASSSCSSRPRPRRRSRGSPSGPPRRGCASPTPACGCAPTSTRPTATTSTAT